MARPDFASVAAFLANLFDRIQAAADAAKAKADAVSPGLLDQYHAEVSAKVAQLRAEISPETFVRVGLEEILASIRTGRSFVRQPPTNLAG